MNSKPLFRRGRASITITLEEPFELLIYCSKYGCDWRLRDPKTKKFMRAPDSIYYICFKKGGLETRKGVRRVSIETEMQGVCEIRREDIRDFTTANEVYGALKVLEEDCYACTVVSRCLGDPLLAFLTEEPAIDTIAQSFSLEPNQCFIHIEEQHGVRYYMRDYEGEIVPCFE